MAKATCAAYLASFLLLVAACTTFESAATTDLTLRNDTSQAVVVKDCLASSCTAFRYSKRISPGASAAATDHGDGRSWWLVLDQNGNRLGCLTLDLTQRVEGYTLRLTGIVTCPTS